MKRINLTDMVFTEHYCDFMNGNENSENIRSKVKNIKLF